MKRFFLYLVLIFIFLASSFYIASAQEEEGGGQQLLGEAYRAPADYPHVESVQEQQMNKIIKQQQEAIQKQNELLKKMTEGEQPGEGVEGAAVPPLAPPKKEAPTSNPISETNFKCRHVTITMPEGAECGYLITTGAEGKSANILMLETSQMRRGLCLLEIECEKPTN